MYRLVYELLKWRRVAFPVNIRYSSFYTFGQLKLKITASSKFGKIHDHHYFDSGMLDFRKDIITMYNPILWLLNPDILNVIF